MHDGGPITVCQCPCFCASLADMRVRLVRHRRGVRGWWASLWTPWKHVCAGCSLHVAYEAALR